MWGVLVVGAVGMLFEQVADQVMYLCLYPSATRTNLNYLCTACHHRASTTAPTTSHVIRNVHSTTYNSNNFIMGTGAHNTTTVGNYYKQLWESVLEEYNAYNIWALFCDIRETLGIFLGGTIFTFAAVTDFVVFDIIAKRW